MIAERRTTQLSSTCVGLPYGVTGTAEELHSTAGHGGTGHRQAFCGQLPASASLQHYAQTTDLRQDRFEVGDIRNCNTAGSGKSRALLGRCGVPPRTRTPQTRRTAGRRVRRECVQGRDRRRGRKAVIEDGVRDHVRQPPGGPQAGRQAMTASQIGASCGDVDQVADTEQRQHLRPPPAAAVERRRTFLNLCAGAPGIGRR